MRMQVGVLGVCLGLFSLGAAQAQTPPVEEPAAPPASSPPNEAPGEEAVPPPAQSSPALASAPNPTAERAFYEATMGVGLSALGSASGALIGGIVALFVVPPVHCSWFCFPDIRQGVEVGALTGTVMGAVGGVMVARGASERNGVAQGMGAVLGATVGGLGLHGYIQAHPEGQRPSGLYLVMPVAAGIGAMAGYEISLALTPPSRARGPAGAQVAPALTPLPGGALLSVQGQF